MPAGTWIGQATTRWVAFLVPSGLGLLAMVVVTTVLPTRSADAAANARGSAPDAGRCRARGQGPGLAAVR